ncbi:DNA-binding protein YbiB [Undibacterium sp. Jales W-56]|uniref:DNA-binding protein YbiB n=1 Tax=Undibacterium sp. Jales W-56 TaxID=2897325 RepID=UPI0021D351CF|nr:DNA-binding protein YbiB [Undibacterium sp. Jales W-56]MCU6434452.1 DNA-binding protein YbiB [Undibacterium sp. Jales W-56]
MTPTDISPNKEAFPAARFIKEIGRGKEGARSMSQDDAQLLYSAMLDARVSDLEMGGILLAMRIKGESVHEIAGFMAAAQGHVLALNAPSNARHAPVIIPSYNGARKKANLTPLLALLLARRGVPVLVHGVLTDAGRVATAEIFEALGHPLAHSAAEAETQMAQQQPAFISIDALSPAMTRILAMRRILGVRNSTHTLVKMLQPFTGAALRLTSYTHPEYQTMLRHYFSEVAPHERGDAFLMRGTEGETVASTGRAQQIDWFHEGQCTTLVQTHQSLSGELPDTPETCDAATTARWIQSVLAGEVAVPPNIADQVEHCVLVAKMLWERSVSR